jgi:hypothetical protein
MRREPRRLTFNAGARGERRRVAMLFLFEVLAQAGRHAELDKRGIAMPTGGLAT